MAKFVRKLDPVTGKESVGLVQSSEIEPGLTDKHYTHEQSVPSATWTVTHNLSKRCSVSVVDSTGRIVGGDVEYVDDNSLTLTFVGGFSGKAYCN